MLREHRAFLQSSAASFDAGYEAEAKRMAVSLRVLLHDTPQSISVFKQLGLKDSWMFDTTADPVDPRNLLPTMGLVVMRVEWSNGTSAGKYVAPLEEAASPARPEISFPGWWMDPIAKLPSTGDTWSRKKYVLELANKEGGAHVDPKLTAAYETLALLNGFGWTTGDPDSLENGTPLGGNPVHESVRQITHEVLGTMARELDRPPADGAASPGQE